MKVIWCCRMVFALRNDKPNFLQYHIDPRNTEIILETSFSSWADYRLPFNACVLYHYCEISFETLRIGFISSYVKSFVFTVFLVYCRLWKCDYLCENQPSLHHKINFFQSSLKLYTIASITMCIWCPFLIGLLFSGRLLTVCKCGFDTMAPVERTKWMTSTWDCILDHGCVHWVSWLTKWTALVSMSSLWSFSGQFLNSCCHLPPHPPPASRPPTPSILWPKIGVYPQKKRPEMA